MNWRKFWKKEIKQYSTGQLLEILKRALDYNHLYIDLVREELANRPDLNKVSLTMSEVENALNQRDYYRKELELYSNDRLDHIINSGMFHDWLVDLAIEMLEKRTGKIIIPRKMMERI